MVAATDLPTDQNNAHQDEKSTNSLQNNCNKVYKEYLEFKQGKFLLATIGAKLRAKDTPILTIPIKNARAPIMVSLLDILSI